MDGFCEGVTLALFLSDEICFPHEVSRAWESLFEAKLFTLLVSINIYSFFLEVS